MADAKTFPLGLTFAQAQRVLQQSNVWLNTTPTLKNVEPPAAATEQAHLAVFDRLTVPARKREVVAARANPEAVLPGGRLRELDDGELYARVGVRERFAQFARERQLPEELRQRIDEALDRLDDVKPGRALDAEERAALQRLSGLLWEHYRAKTSPNPESIATLGLTPGRADPALAAVDLTALRQAMNAVLAGKVSDAHRTLLAGLPAHPALGPLRDLASVDVGEGWRRVAALLDGGVFDVTFAARSASDGVTVTSASHPDLTLFFGGRVAGVPAADTALEIADFLQRESIAQWKGEAERTWYATELRGKLPIALRRLASQLGEPKPAELEGLARALEAGDALKRPALVDMAREAFAQFLVRHRFELGAENKTIIGSMVSALEAASTDPTNLGWFRATRTQDPEEITALQQFLNGWSDHTQWGTPSAPLAVTGQFDEATDRRVREFQTWQNTMLGQAHELAKLEHSNAGQRLRHRRDKAAAAHREQVAAIAKIKEHLTVQVELPADLRKRAAELEAAVADYATHDRLLAQAKPFLDAEAELRANAARLTELAGSGSSAPAVLSGDVGDGAANAPADVRATQQALRALGFVIPDDGVFAEPTRTALQTALAMVGETVMPLRLEPGSYALTRLFELSSAQGSASDALRERVGPTVEALRRGLALARSPSLPGLDQWRPEASPAVAAFIARASLATAGRLGEVRDETVEGYAATDRKVIGAFEGLRYASDLGSISERLGKLARMSGEEGAAAEADRVAKAYAEALTPLLTDLPHSGRPVSAEQRAKVAAVQAARLQLVQFVERLQPAVSRRVGDALKGAQGAFEQSRRELTEVERLFQEYAAAAPRPISLPPVNGMVDRRMLATLRTAHQEALRTATVQIEDHATAGARGRLDANDRLVVRKPTKDGRVEVWEATLGRDVLNQLLFNSYMNEAGKLLAAASPGFGNNTAANPDYWELHELPGGKGMKYFGLKSGAKPSEAINDLLVNPKKYSIECASAVMWIILKAQLEFFGEAAFDSMYKDVEYIVRVPVTDPVGAAAAPGDKHVYVTKERGPLNNQNWHKIEPGRVDRDARTPAFMRSQSIYDLRGVHPAPGRNGEFRKFPYESVLHIAGWQASRNNTDTWFNKLIGVTEAAEWPSGYWPAGMFSLQGSQWYYFTNPGDAQPEFNGENAIVVGMNDRGEFLIYGHPAGIKTEREWIGYLGGRERGQDFRPEDGAFERRSGGSYAGIERYSKVNPATGRFDVPTYKTFAVSVQAALDNAWRYQVGVLERIERLSEFIDRPAAEAAPAPIPRLRIAPEIREWIDKQNTGGRRVGVPNIYLDDP